MQCILFVCSYTLWWSEGVLSYLPVPYDEGIVNEFNGFNSKKQNHL